MATLASAVLGLACDNANHGKDASPTTSQRSSQVSVRLELPSGGAPTVSVLAFHAEAVDVNDVAATDVLGAVDPLVAQAPEASCELRDVAGTARNLRAQGGALNLQELGGVTLTPDGEPPVFLAPRLYPPLADVVSGVIAEAGPLDLAQAPGTLTLEVPGKPNERTSVRLALPRTPALFDGTDAPLDARTTMSMKGDIVLRVAGPPRTFLEIRPFGAPSVIACAVAASGWVVVPHDLVAKLAATAGRAPFSFEAVWRESRLLPAGSETTRVSFEARSSAVLELRP
jgi:hypothetical protein